MKGKYCSKKKRANHTLPLFIGTSKEKEEEEGQKCQWKNGVDSVTVIFIFFYGCEMNEWDFYYGLVGGVKTWKEEELTAVTDWRRVSCVFHDGAFNAPIIPSFP